MTEEEGITENKEEELIDKKGNTYTENYQKKQWLEIQKSQMK